MLLAALKLQLAALVTVAGIDTADINSTDVKSALETLSKAQTDAAAGKGDINKAINDAVEVLKKAAQADDPDANYALALWARQGIINGLDAQTVLAMYQKAAAPAKGTANIPAKAELGALYLQNFPQDSAKVKEGVDLIKSAAAAKNNPARRALAQLTLQGVPAAGLERSVDGAVKLLEEGSAAKDGASTYNLAQIYAAGVSERQADGSTKELLAKSETKALDLLKKAVDQEFAPAMSDYATRLFEGDKDGKGKDPKAAMDMFNKAAEKGNPSAHRNLGLIYENGMGEQTKSMDKAFEHYLTAARGNDGVAQLWMGNVTQNGLAKDATVEKVLKAQKEDPKAKIDIKAEDMLVLQNPAQALSWYRLAAQNNLPQAVYNVGVFYENGAVVDRDLTKAFQLVQRAAVAGIPVAMFRLAGYYQQGAGTTQDPVAAAGWYQRAAKAGLPQAKLVYGIMLENGAGVEQNAMAALENYEAAADAGLPQAMVNAAQIYEKGATGITKNPSKAYKMAALAYEMSNKDENAKTYMKKLAEGLDKSAVEKLDKEVQTALEDFKKRAGGQAAPSADAPATAPASTPAAAPGSSGSSTKKKGTK